MIDHEILGNLVWSRWRVPWVDMWAGHILHDSFECWVVNLSMTQNKLFWWTILVHFWGLSTNTFCDLADKLLKSPADWLGYRWLVVSRHNCLLQMEKDTDQPKNMFLGGASRYLSLAMLESEWGCNLVKYVEHSLYIYIYCAGATRGPEENSSYENLVWFLPKTWGLCTTV